MDGFREVRAKRKDGTPVKFFFRDWGDLHPDDDGSHWVSELNIDGQTYFSRTMKLPEETRLAAQRRLEADDKIIDTAGIDTADMDID